MPLVKAEKQPLTTERLREQLGRLGGTPFKLGELKNHLSGDVLLPVSELNRLRREVAGELERQRAQPKRWKLNDCSSRGNEAHSLIPFNQSLLTSAATNSELIALVRTLAAARSRAEVRGGDASIANLKTPKNIARRLRCSTPPAAALPLNPLARRSEARRLILNSPSTPSIFVAPPRIFKPGEEWMLKQVALLQRRRLPGPQLRSLEVLRQRPAHR